MGSLYAPENRTDTGHSVGAHPSTATPFFGTSAVRGGAPWEGVKLVSAKLRQPSARNIELMLDLFTPTNYREVKEYLQSYPFLTDLLLELYEKVQAYFGSNTQVVLDVVKDPEAENHEELFAVVQAALPRAEARVRLRALDEEWWLDVLDRTQCKLTLDVEYA